jgi:hypothetical protein
LARFAVVSLISDRVKIKLVFPKPSLNTLRRKTGWFIKKKHVIITEIVHLALNNNQSFDETLRQNIKRMCIFTFVSYEI